MESELELGFNFWKMEIKITHTKKQLTEIEG
jgi:hypothetical protein